MPYGKTAVLLLTAAVWLAPAAALGQQLVATTDEPTVEIVHTVGCVERRTGDAEWWLARAADPTVTRPGVFNQDDVDEAREQALGARAFHLVGVADFLGAEALLRSFDRSSFTTPDQANATGELRAGRRVLVKGLLVAAGEVERINLLAVVGLGACAAERNEVSSAAQAPGAVGAGAKRGAWRRVWRRWELAPQNAAKRSSEAQGQGAGGMGRNAEPARRFGALADTCGE